MNRAKDLIALSSGSSSVPASSVFPGDNTMSSDKLIHRIDGQSRTGLLIVNADDWGKDPFTTGRILDCACRGTVSSVSAMVFMEDSERAAAVAQEWGIDAGLHVNVTTPFSAPYCPAQLVEHERKLARYLLGHPVARAVFHPGLVRSFEYVVSAQIDEFCRIYQKDPARLDGHHHMHLCANVVLGGLLPKGTIVRRHFSYEPGEKALRNGIFRQFTNAMLSQRHRLVDYFFSLPPLEPPNRLERIFSLASRDVVELETHPVNPEEYQFLMDGEMFRFHGAEIASRFAVS
jgi:chitin disaccharide deacetylase